MKFNDIPVMSYYNSKDKLGNPQSEMRFMLFVVAYDIPDDGTRTLIANELQNWGHRVQYSVFECELTDKRARQLEKALVRLISARDNIRIYRLCPLCRERSVNMGGKPFAADKRFYQV